MDVLSDVLRVFRLNANVFLHSSFCGSWAVDTSGEHKSAFHLIARGACWLHLPDNSNPVPLRAGDLVVFPRDARHIISNSLEPPAPDQPMNVPGGSGGDGPSTTLICGYFQFEQQRWNLLLDALPEVMVIQGDASANTALMDTLINAIIVETENEPPGTDIVVNKLCEVLFIYVVRTQIQSKLSASNFLAALADPQLMLAMGQIHDHPEEAWTVERLASVSGMSRSAFAARFHQLAGLAPMQYVSQWRMQRAYDLLMTSKLSTASIADQSGYQSEASFAKVFKKYFGKGPGAVRKKL